MGEGNTDTGSSIRETLVRPHEVPHKTAVVDVACLVRHVASLLDQGRYLVITHANQVLERMLDARLGNKPGVLLIKHLGGASTTASKHTCQACCERYDKQTWME